MAKYRSGTDLILSIGGTALGHSDQCKIAYKAETGSRKTKEAADGKWDEKYVKSLSASITASGFVYDDDAMNLPQLETLWAAAVPVEASWKNRGEEIVNKGMFVISQLNHDGKAGDDAKYDISLDNSGAITFNTAETVNTPTNTPAVNAGE